ncbi:MAG TPA: winged helix DNA-binding protein [Nitrososphaerales archaeon]|nr:winged helix DNA-binding protein [Nitrososphaerales archaeon]
MSTTADGLRTREPVRTSTKDANYSLKGNTLRVYMHIIRSPDSDSIGVREIQKQLNFSSPTLAKYHLEKLQEMGLLKQNEEDGRYSLLKEVKVDVLQPFITVSSYMIPRLFTYAVMSSVLFAYFVFGVIPSGNLMELDFFAVAIGAISLFAFWYETLRSWRNSPG